MSPVSPDPAAAEAVAVRNMPVGYMDDLQDSLTRLGHLATGLLSLEESLTRVAQFAVRPIPGAEGAGLTLLEENRSEQVEHRREQDRLQRRRGPRGDQRGDRVGASWSPFVTANPIASSTATTSWVSMDGL